MSNLTETQAADDLHRLMSGSSKSLGSTARRVHQFISDNRALVLASTAAQLGARIGTSDATVVRTVQALGFAGLGDLKRAILASIAPSSTPADAMRRTLADLDRSTGAALDSVLQAHAAGLEVLASGAGRAQLAAAVHLLEPARRIVVFGIGPSAALASYVSVLLARIGRASRVLNATGSMLADQLLDLREGDALLILAYSRLYKEVAAVFGEAKRLDLRTVLVTEAVGTVLAGRADAVVAIPRGRPNAVALHGATIVALEGLVLSLAAVKPEQAVDALHRFGMLRGAVAGVRIRSA